MKKNLLIFTSILIITLLTISFNLFAATDYSEYKTKAQNKVCQMSDKDVLISNPTPLYDLQDKVIALYFTFTNSKGYAIYDLKNDQLSEFSVTSDNPFVKKGSKTYYTGGLSYSKKENNKLIDIKTKESVDFNTAKKNNKDMLKINKPVETTAATYASGSDDLPYPVPNYSYNPTGICGSTAAAMFLRYYNNYCDWRCLPLSMETSNGVTLIDTLVPYIEGNIRASLAYEVCDGIHAFMSDYSSIYIHMSYEGFNYGRVISEISVDKTPCIIELKNHPSYKNHDVVAHGYKYFGSDRYMIVNDGWGSTDVYLNTNYTLTVIFKD